MSALYLTEADVLELVTMQNAITVCEQAFERFGSSQADNLPRARLRTEHVMMHVLAGSDQVTQQLGWKIYTTSKEQARFLVGIYDPDGQLAAIIEADALGQLRTGAASGVATNLLASPAAKVLGLLGAGAQARTQALAIACVRKLERIQVYCRDAQQRTDFARNLAAELDCEVIPSESPEATVESADIITTATTSKTPVFDGNWLTGNVHINAVGSNFHRKAEIDCDTVLKSQLICCDSIAQCQQEAGDLIKPIEAGFLRWDRVLELGDLLQPGGFAGRPEGITLFKSVGLGLQDVALGTEILKRARKTGRGQPLPF